MPSVKPSILKIVFLFFCIVGMLTAQNNKDRAYIKSKSNTVELERLVKFHEHKFQKFILSKTKKFFINSIVNKKGQIGYLSGLDSDGNPEYDFDDNQDAAITSRVNAIRNGGSSGLNLTGLGIEIGHWEVSGMARITHQEFGGRVTHDEAGPFSSHSTHTAVTMIGSGIDPEAKGMATEATIRSRRTDNDEAEIAAFAASGGILSNHSYSTGDPNGNIPEYGQYDDKAEEWDEILYNAPFLFLSKSAGNNRNDGVNTGDNGYDLMYTITTCKNLMVVGAVRDVVDDLANGDVVNDYTGPSSVTQTDFSNWGPTDDWRIKPDIVANGQSVYSGDDVADDAYNRRNGTSMAAPVVTGTVALLQQHYHTLNGAYMPASMVKALLINTTDEAGQHDGPDFQNGWGLLNAERAAQVITTNGSESKLVFNALNNSQTSYSIPIQVDGTKPLTVTLAWTDPQGVPHTTGTDEDVIMLVNDLDIRVTNTTNTYMPWVMAPNITYNNFSDAALKGDNFRDNVERIDVPNIPAGAYSIQVTHKGTLTNSNQAFSVVVNGIENITLSTNKIKNSNKKPLLYPNPSNGLILIDNVHIGDISKITIYNTTGIKIREFIKPTKNSINMRIFNPGVFFVRLDMKNKGTYITKIVMR